MSESNEIMVWGLCHVCEKLVTGPVRPPCCVALTGIRGYGRYYCWAVGCEAHPVKNFLCAAHVDYDPDKIFFQCIDLEGCAGVHSATKLGWDFPVQGSKSIPSCSNPKPSKGFSSGSAVVGRRVKSNSKSCQSEPSSW